MKGPLLLFDGDCNLCNSWVQFVQKHDRNKIISFLSLQSEEAHALQKKYVPTLIPNSSVVFIQNDSAYTESDAILHLAKQINFAQPWLSWLFHLPSSFRNCVYRIVAKYRYRIFGKRNSCAIHTSSLSKK